MTKKNKTKTIAAAVAAGAVALAAVVYTPKTQPAPPQSTESAVEVYFIDVGQGDSALIISDGHAMLIDGGERGEETTVIQHLKDTGVTTLDYVIATHAHSDHIGGLANGILDAVEVNNIIAPAYTPENQPNTPTYEKFLDAVEHKVDAGAKAIAAAPGAVYDLGLAKAEILAPLKSYENENNNSVICKITYGGTSALFTGDAEKMTENDLIEKYGADALHSDLLKAGHHGSNTSSTKEFLASVNPKDMVISCGRNNSYGHPSKDVLARAATQGITVRRTDLLGSIHFVSDGTAWRFADSENDAETTQAAA